MAGFGKILGLGLKSTLEEATEKVPATLPGEQVIPFLKGQGVTSDEMKFSGVMLPTEGVVAKEELQSAVAMRTDKFGVIDRKEGGPTNEDGLTEWYQFVNLVGPDGRLKNLPSYRERIYTYKKGHEDIVTRSPHFPSAENYHAHTRIQDDLVGGQKTRVVLEMQSDTLARARGKGLPREQIDNFNTTSFLAGSQEASEELAAMVGLNPLDTNFLHSERALRREIAKSKNSTEAKAHLIDFVHKWGTTAEQPYNKTMIPRLLEREVLTAQEEGLGRLAIPLEGKLDTLQRGGNQAMYETKVRSQMQKLAKQNGWQYEEVTEDFGTASYTAFKDNAIVEADKILRSSMKSYYGTEVPEVSLMMSVEESSNMLSRILDAADRVYDTLGSIAGDTVQDEDFSFFLRSPVLKKLDDALTAETKLLLKDPNAMASTEALDALMEAKKFLQEPKLLANDILTANEKALTDIGIAKPDKVVYGVINMTDDAGNVLKPSKNFAMYSNPAIGAFAAYSLLSAGLSEKDTKKRLKEDGFDDDDIEQALKDTQFIAQMYSQGIPEAEVRQFLEGEVPKVQDQETVNKQPIGGPGSYWNQDDFGDEGPKSPFTPVLPTMQQQMEKEGENLVARQQREARNWAHNVFARPVADEITTHEYIAALRVVYPPDAAPHTMIAALGGSQEALRKMEETEKNMRAHTIHAIKRELGVDAYFDEEYGGYVTVDGQPLDHGFWRNLATDLSKQEGVLSLGLAGAAAGGAAGAKQGGMRFGPKGAVAGAFIGSMIGAGVMGAVGAQTDYLRELVTTGEAMNGEIMARRAISEAEFAVIGDVAGAALLKLGRAAGGQAAHIVRRVVDFIRAKDTDGAKQALKAHLHIDEEELDEIAAGLGRLTQLDGVSAEEQKLAAAALTQPGGETILSAVVRNTPRTGQALIRQVNARSQNLLKNAESLKDDNAARLIVQDLKNYTHDVKALYTQVKNDAATSTRADMYKFDIDKIAIEPVLTAMKNSVSDMQQKGKLANQLRQIKRLNQSRSFSDLLELRKIVNGIKYAKNAQDYKGQLDDVLKTIDAEIQAGAYKAVDNPQKWLLDWKAANSAYSEMKSVERNVLFKSLTRPGANPKLIGKALYRFSTAIDDTYVSVMAKLPKQTRRAAEAEVFSILSDKYTFGMEGGWKATDFPALAKELEQIPLTTPEARKLQQAVSKMAEVFRNDPFLASVSGEIPLPKFQSYLTADPVVRAKFALASGVFKKFKELAPGEMHNNMALVNILTEVLDKPMNAKLLDQLAKEAGDRIDISAQLSELTQAVARKSADAADEGAPRVALYGEGKILSTKPTETAKAKAESIPMHRIASIEDAKTIAASEGVNLSDIKQVDEILRARGYKAVQLGTNKVRRLD